MSDKVLWPDRLWIIRHGQSAGNLALEKALAARAGTIDIAGRDMDVPLSPLGETQSLAVGSWFSGLPQGQRPTLIMSSPYTRARQSAALIARQLGLDRTPETFVADERLREKEFGLLDRLTRFGIEERFPDEVKRREALGKFYYRPPYGESWCDVILRLRSAWDTICLHYAGKNVAIVAHEVVVFCFRYLLEGLDEKQLLDIDEAGDVANCAVTEYAATAGDVTGSMKLVRYNFVAPLEHAGAAVTNEPRAVAK